CANSEDGAKTARFRLLKRNSSEYWLVMSRENVEIVRRAHAAWSAGDTEVASSVFDATVRWHIAEDEPDAHVIEGIPGTLEQLRKWAASFDDFEVQTIEFIEAGDHVVVPQVFRGRGRNTAAVLE